jgi:hypothetical protein
MADSKITALTALTAADPANDMIPIVDVSDTPPASGNTKRISINNLLACSPSATLASATITGALTVGAAANFNGGVTAGYLNGSLFFGSSGNFTNLYCKSSGYVLYNTAGTFSVLNIDNTGVATFQDGAGSTRMTLNSTGLGVGGSPITSHFISAYGPLGITGTSAGSRTSYITNSIAASIYYTDGGGSGYFTDFGNLIIQPRTSAARSVVIATGSTTPVERAVVKSTGQVRFVPLAADPAGAESGDVYYNSVSNKLKCYNGTTWNDLF